MANQGPHSEVLEREGGGRMSFRFFFCWGQGWGDLKGRKRKHQVAGMVTYRNPPRSLNQKREPLGTGAWGEGW